MPETSKNRPPKHNPYWTSVIDVSLDPYKRIVIPTLYVKQGLGKECYLVEQISDTFKYITVLSSDLFEDYAQRYLERGERTDAEFRDRKRAFFSRVKIQKLSDSKPRITLDMDMLKHLNLVDPAETLSFVGSGDTLELWRTEEYKSWYASGGARNG